MNLSDSPSVKSPIDPRRIVGAVAVSGILLTLLGAVTTWSSGGGVTLTGIQGSHNGWLAAGYALLAAAFVRSLSRLNWAAIAATALSAALIVYVVGGSSPPAGTSVGAGYWLCLSGGLVMLVASLTAAILRLRSPELFSQQHSEGGPWRRRVAGVLAFVVLFALHYSLYTTEAPSWPPPPNAISADDAQAATEQFIRNQLKVRDLGLDFAWSTSASIEPWAEGDEFYPRIFADLESAQSSIHILMFGFKSGSVGSELSNILHTKLDEGVEVRILIDGLGSLPREASNQEMYLDLVDAGARIVVYDPLPLDRDGLAPGRDIDWRHDEFGRADHRKLYVIDGTTAWTGGAGIEDHFRDGSFHDVMVRVTGDVVRQAQAVFLTSFAGHGGPLPADLSPYFPEQPDAGSTPTTIVQVVPGGFVSATQSARDMIDNAQHRIDIMNPYFTDRDMVERVINAAERGVAVRMLTSQRSNSFVTQIASRHNYGDLIDAGVEIWEFPEAVVHAKVIVADDQVQFGTVNLETWALARNHEVAMVADSPEAATLFQERVFEPDIAQSTPGVPPTGMGRAISWLFDRFSWFI